MADGGMTGNVRGYKSVVAIRHEERYFDCPYCQVLVTDNGGEAGFDEGNFVECDNCGKKSYIKGVE